MSKKMRQNRAAIEEYLLTHNVVRARDLIDLGMDGCDIRRLVRRGRFVRLSHGVYRNGLAPRTEEHDHLVAALRAPRAVFVLESAFYFWELIPGRPATVSLGLTSKARRPQIDDLPVRTLWLTGVFGRLPVETWDFNGVPITTLDPAAAVAHALARRDLVSEDVALAALRALVKEDPIQELRVVRFAARCRVLHIVWRHLPRQAVSDDAVCSLIEKYDPPPPLKAVECETPDLPATVPPTTVPPTTVPPTTVPPTTIPPTTLADDDVYWPAA